MKKDFWIYTIMTFSFIGIAVLFGLFSNSLELGATPVKKFKPKKIPAHVTIGGKNITKAKFIEKKREVALKTRNGTLSPNRINERVELINYEIQRCGESKIVDGETQYKHDVNGNLTEYLLNLLEGSACEEI